jgi:hypothetical protein
VQRGKLYYGWTKSRWSLLVSNIVVSICFKAEGDDVARANTMALQFMAYSIFFLIASMATYGKGIVTSRVDRPSV